MELPSALGLSALDLIDVLRNSTGAGCTRDVDLRLGYVCHAP